MAENWAKPVMEAIFGPIYIPNMHKLSPKCIPIKIFLTQSGPIFGRGVCFLCLRTVCTSSCLMSNECGLRAWGVQLFRHEEPYNVPPVL